MAKVLVLATSGFGKTTSIGQIPELGLVGLNPEETFIISATSKPLPFKGSQKNYPSGKPNEPGVRRYISNNGEQIGAAIKYILENHKHVKNIVLDDSNYVMQDYYMANALKKGYDAFKEIGVFMDRIFSAMEQSGDVNFFMLAHYEEFKDSSADTVSYRFKTVGKMVNDYITPEGKFDIVFYGKQTYDEQKKEVSKRFVTNFDGQYPAKSPVGMFKDLYIPNDLGLVKETIDNYYN
jgi:hypothetical protein